jgi:hypothetical protein
VLHQIGIGTLGPVFRTYEPTRDRLVAVKAFRLDIVPEQAQALAAALGRAAQASLFHPSIVEPIEAGVEGTVAYRAEEYVAAESLDVAMRHYAPAPIEKVLPFITQLAGAIDFARAAGIGHGGLHPRDIFVTPDEARATGFGVVEALEQVGIRAPIRRPYSAPERIDGRAWSTPADVFSLAAITFELLTGKRPSGTGAQIGALPDGEFAGALQTVLARAMDDDPSRRQGSALAFAGALEAAAQGRRITEIVAVPSPVVPSPVVPSPVIPSPVVPSPVIPSPVVPSPVVPSSVAPGPAVAPPVFEPTAPEPPVVDAEPEPVVDVELAPTPGEFDIEAALNPVHEALHDVARDPRAASAPTLFDDDEMEDVAGTATADLGDRLSRVEYEPPYAAEASIPAEAPMLRASQLDHDLHEVDDRARSPILPYALTLVVGLLVGFAGGYFLGSRVRLPANESAASTTEQPQPYSEQKVTPPASSSASAPPAAPPATHPAPRATAAAPPPVSAPTVRSTPAAPAPARGQIVVRSQPSRAGVTVNGRWRGRTPLTLDDMAFGSYIVRVVQPGYRVARDEFTLSAREPARSFTARLERAEPAAPALTPPPAGAARAAPAVFTGSLYVDSRPRGAKVTVDGKSVGQTPVTLAEMSAGSHVVRIEMDGKKPVTANPRIVAGQMERVTVSLEDRQDAPAAASEGRREPPRSGGPSAQRAWGGEAGPRASEGKK